MSDLSAIGWGLVVGWGFLVASILTGLLRPRAVECSRRRRRR